MQNVEPSMQRCTKQFGQLIVNRRILGPCLRNPAEMWSANGQDFSLAWVPPTLVPRRQKDAEAHCWAQNNLTQGLESGVRHACSICSVLEPVNARLWASELAQRQRL